MTGGFPLVLTAHLYNGTPQLTAALQLSKVHPGSDKIIYSYRHPPCRCDSYEHCTTVCKRGSVVVNPSLQKAIATQVVRIGMSFCATFMVMLTMRCCHVARLLSFLLQLELSRRLPLCYASLVGTHNSGISLADGYGNLDLAYQHYFRWISWLVSTFCATGCKLVYLKPATSCVC